jgi:hypothetical protein
MSKTTRTIRVEPYLLEMLKNQARKNGQSENSLVASILENYLKVGVWTDSIPVIMLRKEHLLAFLSPLPESEIAAIGRELGEEVDQASVRFMYPDFTPQTFLDIIGAQSKYMRWGAYTSSLKGDVLEVHIRHDYGRKWSVFLEAYVGQEGANLLESDVEGYVAKGMVSLKFTPRKKITVNHA